MEKEEGEKREEWGDGEDNAGVREAPIAVEYECRVEENAEED